MYSTPDEGMIVAGKRQTIALVACVLALVSLVSCAKDTEVNANDNETLTSTSTSSSGENTTAAGSDATDVSSDDPFREGIHHAEIEVEGFGTITLALNANAAPETVSNFCHLAQEGFYDGLSFHRIIKGFMIQGGDPEGNGTGGSGSNITGEFAENGFNNPIAHVRGTISMARANDPNSASSQFFIMHATDSSLNGKYAAFGTVQEGMDVVDAIAETTPVLDNNGTVAPENQPKITAIRVID